MKLTGKKALVTGASRGIGKAIALDLARQGCALVLHYHEDENAANEVLEEVKRIGVKAALVRADFSLPDSVAQMGAEAWELLDGVDLLINNAGVSYKKHFLDITPAEIDYFTNINFKSTFILTQTIIRKMVCSAIEGSVYTITSINGVQPGVGLSVYGATKGALETLMKGIALEIAPHNIRVNTIAVGAIQTDMNAAVWQDENKLKLVNAAIPLGRIGQAEEVASVISGLLLSGTYMTGSTIVVDGGWTLKQGFVGPAQYENKESI